MVSREHAPRNRPLGGATGAYACCIPAILQGPISDEILELQVDGHHVSGFLLGSWNAQGLVLCFGIWYACTLGCGLRVMHRCGGKVDLSLASPHRLPSVERQSPPVAHEQPPSVKLQPLSVANAANASQEIFFRSSWRRMICVMCLIALLQCSRHPSLCMQL